MGGRKDTVITNDEVEQRFGSLNDEPVDDVLEKSERRSRGTREVEGGGAPRREKPSKRNDSNS